MAAPPNGVKGSVARGTLTDSVRLSGGEPEAVQLRRWGEELNEKQRVRGTDRGGVGESSREWEQL